MVLQLVYYHSGGLRLNPNLYNCGKVCLIGFVNYHEGSSSPVAGPLLLQFYKKVDIALFLPHWYLQPYRRLILKLANKQGLNVDDCPLPLFSNITDFVFHFLFMEKTSVWACVLPFNQDLKLGSPLIYLHTYLPLPNLSPSYMPYIMRFVSETL